MASFVNINVYSVTKNKVFLYMREEVPRGLNMAPVFICANILYGMDFKKKLENSNAKSRVVSTVYSSRHLLHACLIKHSIVDFQT